MTAPRNIGDQIRKLRLEGMSYSQICDELDCSKGTVSYHLSDGGKERQKNYQSSNRTMIVVCKKINRFCNSKENNHIYKNTSAFRTKMNDKIQSFRKNDNMQENFSYQELMDKIGDEPTCYLTGDKITLSKTRSWHLDHKTPVSKGGENSLDNCEIATREANQAKHDMPHEEFLELCQKVLINNGYSVTKKK